MTAAYTPQQGSSAWRVIEFFITNPDERLTPSDLEAKFDKPAKQWHSILGAAVQAGVLRRDDRGDELEYCLGSGHAGVKPNPGRNPTARPDALPAGVALGKKRSVRSAVEIDIGAVVLRDSVPLPKSRTAASKWTDLLNRMRVGQSCVLPRDYKSAVSGTVCKANKAGATKFSMRVLSETEIGLWRVE